jgi:alkylation response protein AidB-like acyl-CoA dehydrogenase
VDGGWKVAMGLLGVERGTTLLPMQMSFEREVLRIVAAAQENGRASDPIIRQKVARCLTDVHVLRATVLRSLAPVMNGGEPGRESAMTKVFASEAHQRIAALALDVQGLAGQVVETDLSDVQRGSLLSRAESIYGGTSQIQRNLIGERALGLPREPR